LFCIVAAVPALAGSTVIGSVAGTSNATVGGQSLLLNSTIFSGDSLQVRDGVAVVAIGQSGRMVFGRDTAASFLRDANEVTVLLSQGNVSLYHFENGTAVRVEAGNVSVTPTAGFKSFSEVAMLNGSVVVTAKEGSLRVDDHGASKTVAKGETIVIAPKTADQKPGGGGGGWGGGSEGLEIAAVAAGATAAVLAGVGIKRADNATTAANAATAAANAATAAANTANTTAQSAATSAAAAAASSANALQVAQCTYDALVLHSTNSPFVPTTACPALH